MKNHKRNQIKCGLFERVAPSNTKPKSSPCFWRGNRMAKNFVTVDGVLLNLEKRLFILPTRGGDKYKAHFENCSEVCWLTPDEFDLLCARNAVSCGNVKSVAVKKRRVKRQTQKFTEAPAMPEKPNSDGAPF